MLSLLRLKLLQLVNCCNLTITQAVGELPSLETLAIQHCHKLVFQEHCFTHNAFAALSLRTLILQDCGLHILPHQVSLALTLAELHVDSPGHFRVAASKPVVRF